MSAETEFHTQLSHATLGACPQALALGLATERIGAGEAVLRLPWREHLVGDLNAGVIAGGPVTTLLDHVGGQSVWVALGRYAPIATLDMRIDYMRPARPREDLLGLARCYKLTRSVAFVRALAYETDPDDPVAAAQGAYMLTGAVARRARPPVAAA